MAQGPIHLKRKSLIENQTSPPQHCLTMTGQLQLYPQQTFIKYIFSKYNN
ncbi:hypothetical protein Hanom_Chr02g00174771 [Helianthus anomalus]